jgi:hypothetical protein
VEDRNVRVHDLDELRRPYGNKPLRLFIAGIELKNMDVDLFERSVAGTSVLRAQLAFDNENADNRRAWVQLIQIARNRKVLDVSIGPEGGPQFPSTASARLNVFPQGWAIFSVGAIALLILATGILGARSNLLRAAPNATGVAPFSLAKHQMAAWFLAVIGSYLFVALMTGTTTSVSTSALVLIGISAATGLAAVAIDGQHHDQDAKSVEALQAEKQAIEDALGGLRTQRDGAAAGSREAADLATAVRAKEQRLAG